VEGKRLLEEYADEHGIARATPGKVIVALDESELGRLADLERRGRENGVEGLRVHDTDDLRALEPNVRGIRALHAPTAGVIDYRAVAASFAADVRGAGGTIELGRKVTALTTRNGSVDLDTPGASFTARAVVTCGGLQSDRLARLTSGGTARPRIVPFRGDYYTLGQETQELVRGLLYPVPDPAFPFLGVHFTKRLDGSVVAGPNAVLAFAREGYKWTDFNLRDFAESLTFLGLWKFMAKYPSMCGYEIRRSLSKAEFTRSLQRLVPEIRAEDLETGGAGVRAQAMTADGKLVEDFHFEEAKGVLHVVNAPSPAATASLAIGRKISERVLAQLN
jgi:L-2-hydroxyglutarate oxidase LhgO